MDAIAMEGDGDFAHLSPQSLEGQRHFPHSLVRIGFRGLRPVEPFFDDPKSQVFDCLP